MTRDQRIADIRKICLEMRTAYGAHYRYVQDVGFLLDVLGSPLPEVGSKEEKAEQRRVKIAAVSAAKEPPKKAEQEWEDL